MIDLANAETFMATHARLLDRRRLAVLLGQEEPAGLLAALSAYRNPDGGFGWALEADLRSPSSQPAGALHAFEVLEEAAPATSPMGAALCDWLATATLPGGGLPFSVAGAAGPGTARWWAGADPGVPSLHITAAVAGHALRAAAHDPTVAAHPWLAQVTDWTLERIAAQEQPGHAYELKYTLQFLDAALGARPEAEGLMERTAAFVPASGELAVAGGVEGEKLRSLEIAPLPDRPLRRLMPAAAIARQLDELEARQQPDGGWTVDFPSSSVAAALEWRGVATVLALITLRANQRA
ncbi:hypothetical protein [Conexibacter woesei]|uniref:Uncharacterized protein n=1 Tax=Conexibacter woesei (strain DSM 14684 / CCUG 47730 / CIP 108061 / JCM 11494 / NBRC 100937 / ID131577) TaxID=469383 RepID=D3F645_CONWI|nr:hypothetical protein [Conexibacter woesei]ADB48718.1 hypothetical protein Cwoe_0282 [Conexibacter woesei DSM 14684]